MTVRPTAGATALKRLLIACCLLATSTAPLPALAQGHDPVSGAAADLPALPTGPARIAGRIVHPTNPDAAARLEVVLYALSPDGAPGLGTTHSDEAGAFRFEGISNVPGVIYLLGTRYLDVPYGSRVTFEEGSVERVVEIPLSDVTTSTKSLEVVQSAYKLDWIGARLRVQVQHRIHNHGGEVILRASDAAEPRPIFRATLPAGAEDWSDGHNGFGSGLVREGDEIAFFGPAYTGDQEIGFEYFMPADGNADAASVDLQLAFPDAPGEVIVLSSLNAPAPVADRLQPADAPTELEGGLYRRAEAQGLRSGETLALRLAAPASSHDLEALTLSRADFWLDPDDAAMRVTVEFQLEVDATTRLVAPPGEVLLPLPIPADAEFLGLSEQARGLNVVPWGEGGLAVVGPIPPGASTLGYKYRVPVDAAESELNFAITRPVALLNVLVADVGIDVSGERLHRRRPFRQGTRIYLHREAFQLAAGERVSVGLTTLDRSSPPKTAVALAALVVAALAALFIGAPLRGRNAVRDTLADVRTVLSQERAGVYESIRDIDHDFETGKIDAAEHARMRGDLKQEAIGLLRRERAQTQDTAAVNAPDATQPTAAAAATDVAVAEFCPHCGGQVNANWTFCSHCGARIREAEADA